MTIGCLHCYDVIDTTVLVETFDSLRRLCAFVYIWPRSALEVGSVNLHRYLPSLTILSCVYIGPN